MKTRVSFTFKSYYLFKTYINFQVTTLVNHPKKKGSKLGKSKNAHKLAQDIEDATARLIKTGEDIAQEFPEIREEMLAACKDCRGAGVLKFSCT